MAGLSYFVIDIGGVLASHVLYNVHRVSIVSADLLIVGTEGATF